MQYEAVQEYDAPVDKVIEFSLERHNVEMYPNVTRIDLIKKEQVGDKLKIVAETRGDGTIPPAMRHLVTPDLITWVENGEWDFTKNTYDYFVIHKKFTKIFKCIGHFEFTPLDGGRSRRTLKGDIKVSVPILGAIAEKTIVKFQKENLEVDVKFVNEWYKKKQIS